MRMDEKKFLEGHRKRLRERFLKTGFSSFYAHEILELLLTVSRPRVDCKKPAKRLLKKFGSLKGVFDADTQELQKVKDIGPVNAFNIKLIHKVAGEYLAQKIKPGRQFKMSKEVFDYFYHSMSGMKKEVFRVVFLNVKNRVIEISDMFEGTVNWSNVYPREVVLRALKNASTSAILVHNHPSGDPSPSEADKRITKNLTDALKLVQIKVLDHVIIGAGRHFSFKDNGLI